MSALKAALFFALAVLLGAGHSVCADGVTDAAIFADHQHHSFHAHINHADDRNGQMQAFHKSTPNGPTQHECQHCNSAQFYNSSAKTQIAASLVPPAFEKVVDAAYDTVVSHIISVSDTHFARPWHGPQRTTLTSLKVRLLI